MAYIYTITDKNDSNLDLILTYSDIEHNNFISSDYNKNFKILNYDPFDEIYNAHQDGQLITLTDEEYIEKVQLSKYYFFNDYLKTIDNHIPKFLIYELDLLFKEYYSLCINNQLKLTLDEVYNDDTLTLSDEFKRLYKMYKIILKEYINPVNELHSNFLQTQYIEFFELIDQNLQIFKQIDYLKLNDYVNSDLYDENAIEFPIYVE